MIYTLYIWTVIAMVGDHHGIGAKEYGWQPAGEYRADVAASAMVLCEDAAKQLSLKPGNYRCVRSK